MGIWKVIENSDLICCTDNSKTRYCIKRPHGNVKYQKHKNKGKKRKTY